MEFYLCFQAAHPLVIFGKRMFDFLQPFWIKRLKERNICCCIYHVEMQELLVGFNYMRAKSGLHSQSVCECECEEVCRSYHGTNCAGSLVVFSGVTAMSKMILCPKPEGAKWHTHDCLFGNCTSCGVDFLPLCPEEEDASSGSLVKWKHFAIQVIRIQKGKERKKLQLVSEETTTAELVSYMKPKLQAFVRHAFLAKWEDEQFRACLASFLDDTMVSVIDYAENYSFEVQNEVQSMHWHSY
jgi:hypothetical protein